MPASERTIIYQLFVRHFGNENPATVYAGTIAENGCGKLASIDGRAIRHIVDLGATHVWLTGVLRHASLSAYPEIGLEADDPDVVKGRAGSPYAIKDYYDVDPDLAVDPRQRHAELDALIARLHAAGLKVLLDLVPNHVARDYRGTIFPERDLGRDDDQHLFFSARNDFFYLAEPPGQALVIEGPSGWDPGGLDKRFPREDGSPGHTPRATGNNVTGVRLGTGDWYETVKLSYGFDFTTNETRYDPIPPVWTKIDAIVEHWQTRGIDGFRCDFSHWVPVEFWRFLITRARERNPAAYFLAEAYDNGPGVAQVGSPPGTFPESLVTVGGFDATYDHRAFDVTRRIASGMAWANDLERLPGDRSLSPAFARYVENHDERRAASAAIQGRNPGDTGMGSFEGGLVAAAALFLSTTAPVLVYAGQELGESAGGASGYGGDDGRSSIFDYVSPTTLCALHLAGYARDALKPDVRRRIERLAGLLTLCRTPVIAHGRVAELNDLNRHDPTFGELGHWAYACLRSLPSLEHGGPLARLVVVNFHATQALSTRVRLTDEAIEHLGLRDFDAASLRVRRLDAIAHTPIDDTTLAKSVLVDEGIPIELGALEHAVWSLEVMT